eukprot:11389619-Alexandrium_andersonii.AAC.1
MASRTASAQVPFGARGRRAQGALAPSASSGEADLPDQRRRPEPVELELGRVLVPVGNWVQRCGGSAGGPHCGRSSGRSSGA